MNYVEIVVSAKKKFDFNNFDEAEFNEFVCSMIKKGKNGDGAAKIYEGILSGKTQVGIAKENGLSINVVNNCVVKLRRLVDGLKHVGFKVKGFENFECRKYEFSEETKNKMKEERNKKLGNR